MSADENPSGCLCVGETALWRALLQYHASTALYRLRDNDETVAFLRTASTSAGSIQENMDLISCMEGPRLLETWQHNPYPRKLSAHAVGRKCSLGHSSTE